LAAVRREVAGLLVAADAEAAALARAEVESEPDAMASVERAAAVGLAEGLRMALEVIDGQ
jgi:hypothetical protein